MSLPSEHPLKIALCNAASEPRTLEELLEARARIDEKLRDYRKHTDRQLQGFSKEKKRLERAIADKQFAYGLRNGSVVIVPGRPVECEPGRWMWSDNVALRSMARDKKRYIKTNWRRGMRAMRATGEMNFGVTPDVVRGRPEDQKA
jgi:hypothetical protein